METRISKSVPGRRGPPPSGKRSSGDYERRTYLARLDLDEALNKLKYLSKQDKSDAINEAVEIYLAGVNRVPVVGHVRGGPPNLAEEHVEEVLTLPARLARGANLALRVRGDSMAPELKEGDIALIRSQPEAQHNQIVVATVGETGDEGLVKRVVREQSVPFLRSDNPDYPERWHPGDYRIIGLVVGIIREYE